MTVSIGVVHISLGVVVEEPVEDGILALTEHSYVVVVDTGRLLDSEHPPGVVVDTGPFEGISELIEHGELVALVNEHPPGVVVEVSPVDGMEALE